MNSEDLLSALQLLGSADHFDEARRAAALLPDDIPVTAVLRAADGAEQVARALDTRRRVLETAREHQHDDERRSLYS